VLPSNGPLEPIAHVGVTADRGIYRSVVVASRSGPLTELVVTVPHDLSVSTSIFSRTLKFSTSTGIFASAAAIVLTPGVADVNISLTVGR
jgi:hypothetical protein